MAQAAITYRTDLTGVTPDKLAGFFDKWLNPPSPGTHLRILQNSSHIVLAWDSEADRIVGFIHAISDGFFAASIPLLEVLPDYRRRGIGHELVKRMLDQLSDFYSVDLACDPPLQAFYSKLGMHPASGMMMRNVSRQATGLF